MRGTCRIAMVLPAWTAEHLLTPEPKEGGKPGGWRQLSGVAAIEDTPDRLSGRRAAPDETGKEKEKE